LEIVSLIVQKFGGTSVSTETNRDAAVKRIREALAEGLSPVAVVSAMGRSGDPYATDTLKSLAEVIYPRLPLRELDLLMSCGEIISAVVLSATLYRAGIKAAALTGAQAGLVSDGCYGEARVVSCEPGRLQQLIKDGIVPVIAGFQGADPSGEIQTLGRGGSDTTAVIIGAALKASRVEIFTDVDGISTADPRLCREAKVIRCLAYSEVCQLAYEGAKVIHPAAVEVAMNHNVNVAVRSLTEKGPGTLINMTGTSAVVEGYAVQPRHVVTGIAHATEIVQIRILFEEPDSAREAVLFEGLAGAGISIDLINVFPTQKIFTIKQDMLARAEAVLQAQELKFTIEKDCAKVSVVGLGMRGIPGVMSKVVRAFKEKDIGILQTADSNITISLLIHEEDLAVAVQTLHDHFSLGQSGEVCPSYQTRADEATCIAR
jgi:aspartate kinase